MGAIGLFAGGGLPLGSSAAGFSHNCAYEWSWDSCEALGLNASLGHPLIAGTRVVRSDARDGDWSRTGPDVDQPRT